MEQFKLWEDKISKCERCGRTLTNPESIKEHKGLICQIKSQYEERLKYYGD